MPPHLSARQGDARALALALQDSRRDTLATFAAYESALPRLVVPHQPGLNPPLWELGHIGWFQEFWLARNPVRGGGAAADPNAPRHAPLRMDADALYDSSRVPHDTRWALPLPDAERTQFELEQQLATTLKLLLDARHDDDALYFFRLALLHEDMHHEAALYMARGLGLAIDDARWAVPSLPDPTAPIAFEPGPWTLGSADEPGFVFDNELRAQNVELPATTIDAQVVRWAEYLPFLDSSTGVNADAPRYLRRDARRWQQWRRGRWSTLDTTQPACHLTHQEALAWCAWAGRRLPTEAEWERAALSRPEAFLWGDVWEWTASPFAPFAGFKPHPYRDYSAPWFDGRPVLRGASFLTQPRMRHPRYRNFFESHRNDLPAGFRSCARY